MKTGAAEGRPEGVVRWASAWGATAALYALSFPPLALDLLIFVAFAPLILAASRWGARGFRRGAFFGHTIMAGHQLFWITSMTTVGSLSWVGWLAVVALYLVLALPLILGLKAIVRRGWSFGLALVIAIPGHEVLRETVLSGLSWASPGYALGNRPVLIQSADVGDVHLVSAVVLVVNAALAALFGASSGRRLWGAVGAGAMALGLALTYGTLRMDSVSRTEELGPRLLGLQTNVSLEERAALRAQRKPASWELLPRHLEIAREGLQAAGEDGVDLIVWPETSAPPIDEASAARRLVAYPPDRLFARSGVRALAPQLRGALGDRDVPHLLGLQLYSDLGEGEEAATRFGHAERNVALLVRPREGGLVEEGRYAKSRLVPFGERVPNVPFRSALKRMIDGRAGFTPALTPGTDSGVMEAARPLGTFGTSVCYEIIFPDLFAAQRRAGAEYFINISNDVWYGDSAEMDLVHLALRFRAVENRRSIFRVGNTGISALLDPAGRERAVVERDGQRRHVAGPLLGQVPRSGVAPGPEPLRIGLRWGWALAALMGGLAARFGKSFGRKNLGS